MLHCVAAVLLLLLYVGNDGVDGAVMLLWSYWHCDSDCCCSCCCVVCVWGIPVVDVVVGGGPCA